MAELKSLVRWQPYTPDIGENRKLPKPFSVLLAVGLTKPQLEAMGGMLEGLKEVDSPEGQVDKLAGALNEYVRMGPEPLTINGEAVDSLSKLLRLYLQLANGAQAMLELAWALRMLNSVGGSTELFFARLSGGFGSTESQGAAR